MLRLSPPARDGAQPADAEIRAAVWIDLRDADEAEAARVAALTGLKPPSRHDVSEIEASSRLRHADGVLYLSAPLIARVPGDLWSVAPTGFVLSAERLLTVRFAEVAAFDAVAEALAAQPCQGAGEIFVRILEEIVDRAADRLERTAEELNAASREIFTEPDAAHAGGARRTLDLRRVMRGVGRAAEHMSIVRYVLVTVGRLAQFAVDRAAGLLGAGMPERLAAVRADLASLEQYEENLLSRIQQLQDAATAFISIEQNEVVKVLTIASVVGIPPVLVVGVYGMNFKIMPELNWTFGYPYALALIVVSALVPILWFRSKDWM